MICFKIRYVKFIIYFCALFLGFELSYAGEGDPAAGEKVFLKCRACHQIGENAHNLVGPELNGVIGRPAGSVPDYNYSTANKTSGIIWDEATFREYIKNPQAKVKGTKMSFSGLTSERDVDDIVAFLKQYDAEGKKMAP